MIKRGNTRAKAVFFVCEYATLSERTTDPHQSVILGTGINEDFGANNSHEYPGRGKLEEMAGLTPVLAICCLSGKCCQMSHIRGLKIACTVLHLAYMDRASRRDPRSQQLLSLKGPLVTSGSCCIQRARFVTSLPTTITRCTNFTLTQRNN
jgi:hypothetical protein